MAYVLEKISDEDYVSWSMEEVENKYYIPKINEKIWTVNREKDSFLREVKVGRFEDRGKVKWLFKWRKKYVILVSENVDKINKTKDYWVKKKIIDYSEESFVEDNYSEFYKDFYDALLAYREFGLASYFEKYSLELINFN